MAKKAPAPKYDDMNAVDRAFALFTACEKARETGGHRAALRIWNDWAMPLIAEREKLIADKEWEIVQKYDSNFGEFIDTGSNQKTRNFLNRANLNAKSFIFHTKGWVDEKGKGSKDTQTPQKKLVKTIATTRIECEEINFSHLKFPANTSFRNAVFAVSAYFPSAVFRSLADFTNTEFRGKASFHSAVLVNNSFFIGTKFRGDTDFRNAKFVGITNSECAEFNGNTYFRSAVFKKTANFINTKFNGITDFGSTDFKSDADFSSAEFKGEADFSSAEFTGNAYFSNAEFKGEADFRSAEFKGDASFRGAEFKGDADFNIATFSATATFADAKYFSGCDFTAIHSERAFDLANAEFYCQVPRFIQAHFSESPRLDHLELPYPARESERMPQIDFRLLVEQGWRLFGINPDNPKAWEITSYSKPVWLEKCEELENEALIGGRPDDMPKGERWHLLRRNGRRYRQRLLQYVPAEYKHGKQIDQNDIAAYTALRKMALGAQDHDTEAAAFKGEMRSKRASSKATIYCFFSLWYDRLFDFGYSYRRPIISWVVLFGLMVGFYGISAGLHHPAPRQQPAICKNSFAVTHASLLSANNALLFAMASQREFINRAYHCLYGADDAALKKTALPAYVGIFGGIHTLLSAILLFFILLALRNRFRIK